MRRIGLWLSYFVVSAVFGVGWLVLLSLPISLCWQVLGGMWSEPTNYRALTFVIGDLAAASAVTSLLFIRPISKARRFGEQFGLSFLFAAVLAVIWGEIFGISDGLLHGTATFDWILGVGVLAGYSIFYAYASFYIVIPFATIQIWALHGFCRWASLAKESTAGDAG